jgi:quercetin dioxygenase-like cupin family protein
MRRVITGPGPDGRSTVLSDGPPPVAWRGRVSEAGTPELAKQDGATAVVRPGEGVVYELWGLDDQPRTGIDDPTPAIEQETFDPPPAHTKWIITELGPGGGAPMHFTPTVDYGVIVAGEVTMGLEDGEVLLRAGDTVLVDRTLHSWLAGPEGCVIATVQVGLRDEDR